MSLINVTYTGNGATVLFSIPFPYLSPGDIEVLVNGSQTTAFTFANATTIQFNVAPINGATILIQRVTDPDIANRFFPNSSIPSNSLNDNFQQSLYVAEEAREIAKDAQLGNLVPGSIGTASLADGAVTNQKVSATAAIVDTKLATIATAGKVSNSATTATSANTNSAIVARDGSGNFSAGTITAALTGAASSNVLKAGDTMTGALLVDDSGTAALPAIAFDGDTNTGIFSPGADQVAISTNGTQRATVDSSGRLLVGTSSSRNVGSGTNALFQIEQISAAISQSIVANNNGVVGSILSLGKSRGTTAGSFTIVQNADELGSIRFAGADGTDIETRAASIDCFVDGTPGANDMPGRLVFSTTADGASFPTERLRIKQNGSLVSVQTYNNTIAQAANVNIQSDGELYRATSSIKYKTDVQTLENSYADAILNCRPVWYRSKCEADNPAWGWWGFIAEEVAAIDPRLVHWKTVEVTYDEKGSAVQAPCDPEPEGVQYDRFVPHLLNLIKRQKEQIEALEARLTALESA